MTYNRISANFRTFSALLLFLPMLISCKFEKQKSVAINSESEKTSLENQIAYITYGTDPNAEKWYEYNEKGDLIRQAISVDTIVFEYNNNKIVKRHLDKKSSWQSRIDYITDQNGRITVSECYDENDKLVSKNQFLYDAEGYLIKIIEDVITSKSKYINEYAYKSGNLKEVKSYTSSGSLNSRYIYEYYPERPNNINLFMQQISDDIFPNGRLGKKNTNMVRQISNIGVAGDTLSLLKYEFINQPAKDKMVQKEVDVLNEFESVITFHFKAPIK